MHFWKCTCVIVGFDLQAEYKEQWKLKRITYIWEIMLAPLDHKTLVVLNNLIPTGCLEKCTVLDKLSRGALSLDKHLQPRQPERSNWHYGKIAGGPNFDFGSRRLTVDKRPQVRLVNSHAIMCNGCSLQLSSTSLRKSSANDGR